MGWESRRAPLVVRGSRERGILDDQIARLVEDSDGVPYSLARFHADQRLASGEQGVGLLAIKRVECADVNFVLVDAVGHCADLGQAVGERGRGLRIPPLLPQLATSAVMRLDALDVNRILANWH